MTDETPSLLDTPRPGQNLPEFTVSELATGIKTTLEETFGRVRLRGEISQPKMYPSGLYFSLKDENAVIDAVCWKGTLGKLAVKPEDGMDVVVTGKVSSYPGRSKYQIIVDSMTLAGQGALLKMLQDRKEKLQKEGLFDDARKKSLPKYPQTIGIITSPQGAVIKDILHRLEDRFPVRVLLWPVAVQGEKAALEVANAIAGMNALENAPDVIIVARGGGSLEDLMAFNEEIVVRAAAASRIPLISGVGHEPDYTLIDFAADVRAPTPTAAAELATPVRRELLQGLASAQQQLNYHLQKRLETTGLRLETLSHKLGSPARYLEQRLQAFDFATDGLKQATARLLQNRLQSLAALHLLHPRALLKQGALQLGHHAHRLQSVTRAMDRARQKLEQTASLLESYSYQRILNSGFALVRGKDGTVVTAAKSLKAKDDIQLTFADGSKEAVIK
ncbi:MAG: exodeoxyribonuclease VII large subunit [Bdellovibrionales bacterium]